MRGVSSLLKKLAYAGCVESAGLHGDAGNWLTLANDSSSTTCHLLDEAAVLQTRPKEAEKTLGA
jgi:hypothetical protein